MKTQNKLTRIGSIAALAVGGLAIMVALSCLTRICQEHPG